MFFAVPARIRRKYAMCTRCQTKPWKQLMVCSQLYGYILHAALYYSVYPLKGVYIWRTKASPQWPWWANETALRNVLSLPWIFILKMKYDTGTSLDCWQGSWFLKSPPNLLRVPFHTLCLHVVVLSLIWFLFNLRGQCKVFVFGFFFHEAYSLVFQEMYKIANTVCFSKNLESFPVNYKLPRSKSEGWIATKKTIKYCLPSCRQNTGNYHTMCIIRIIFVDGSNQLI